jgi:late competence protein required for DNA uptake (superfamily II DNA/RNA helicase)
MTKDSKKRGAKKAGLSVPELSEAAQLPLPPARLVDINQHIKCTLCGGYLREAYTIVQCMHTFCKSCLLLRLGKIKGTQICPHEGCSTEVMCRLQKDSTFKVKGMLADSTMQSLTDKCVPDVVEEDKRLEELFYAQQKAAKAEAGVAVGGNDGAGAGAADPKKSQSSSLKPQSMTEQAPFF